MYLSGSKSRWRLPVTLACACALLAGCGSSKRSEPSGQQGVIDGTMVLHGPVNHSLPTNGGYKITAGDKLVASGIAGQLHQGNFRAELPPGRYSVTGIAGSVPCGPVTVQVTAGKTSPVELGCAGN